MPKTNSPLRYPGGKTKLYKLISPIVTSNVNNAIYIEPFAGGAGLALELLFNQDVETIVLNDIDYCIYCFWSSCLNLTDQLCDMIYKCNVNIDTWVEQKNIYSTASCHSTLEVGFATFFLNRCNISGVIQGGPIGGKEQKGKYLIDARFNREDLIKKIKRIGGMNERIVFYNLDALNFIQNVVPRYPIENTFLNIDPPYVKKGPMLYENSFTNYDHAELSNLIKLVKHKWIVTYDECDLIYNLYANYRIKPITLSYSAGQTKSGNELLILSDYIK